MRRLPLSLGAPALVLNVQSSWAQGCHCHGNYRTENILALERREGEMFQLMEAALLDIIIDFFLWYVWNFIITVDIKETNQGPRFLPGQINDMMVGTFGYRMSFIKKTIRTINCTLAPMTQYKWLMSGCRSSIRDADTVTHFLNSQVNKNDLIYCSNKI